MDQTTLDEPKDVPLGGSETILLVEDEPAILDVAGTMLKNLGYTLLAAESPLDAVKLAAEHKDGIHLLMTDVVMPEMNGRDLAKQLKNDNPELKVLFMSGYTANVIAHHGVLEKGVHFIQKPFTNRDLAFSIRSILDGK
jgi:CheY-like chemotaxis protein